MGVSDIVRFALLATTFEESVIKAAISSEVLPFISIALVTVTVPVVVPPIALNSLAVIAVPSASLTDTVASFTSTFVDSVTNAAVN